MVATLLLSRPQESSERFAREMRALGWAGPVMIAPLQRIVLHLPVRQDVAGAESLIFTSQHAVAAWQAAGLDCDLPVCCVGPRSAEAAREAGFGNIRQAPGGDAVSLLAMISADPPPAPMLHLRGQHVAMPLAEKLAERGIEARELVVYRQEVLPLQAAACELLSRPGDVVVPLFSPRSARLFAQAFGPLPQLAARLHVVAISPACLQGAIANFAPRPRIARTPDAQGVADELVALQRELVERGKPR
ncbi:MAG: uroporphyrinogen-III synthase [Rhodobacteraceae bacterium]|nr:uroporphyrinogen-III synthase [Paracoccaceae bacterium]